MLGPDHPDTLISLNNLAAAYETAGDVKKAIPLYEDCLKRREKVLGKDHPDTIRFQYGYALALVGLGRSGEAEPLLRQAYERDSQVPGAEPGHE